MTEKNAPKKYYEKNKEKSRSRVYNMKYYKKNISLTEVMAVDKSDKNCPANALCQKYREKNIEKLSRTRPKISVQNMHFM